MSPTAGANLADLQDRGFQAFVPHTRSCGNSSFNTHAGAPPSYFYAQWKYRYISTFPSVPEVETVDALSCFPQHRRVHTMQRTACNSSQGADPPRFAMQHLSFPFITISPLLSFSNANGPVSFVLYFVLHVTFLLPITPVSTADWLVPSASSAFALEHSKDSAAEIALPALPPARAG